MTPSLTWNAVLNTREYESWIMTDIRSVIFNATSPSVWASSLPACSQCQPLFSLSEDIDLLTKARWRRNTFEIRSILVFRPRVALIIIFLFIKLHQFLPSTLTTPPRKTQTTGKNYFLWFQRMVLCFYCVVENILEWQL